MSEVIWGLMGPGEIGSTRRVRTLGLSSSARVFNDLAVPGIGGAWFGKQLMLSTLGVALARSPALARRSIPNIAMANAVEALACALTLAGGKADGDPRVRGSTKVRGKQDLSFAIVRKPGFYVTQPMRMATVQALPALGLVDAEGSRFNAFTCTDRALDFLDEALGTAIAHLEGWANGQPNERSGPVIKALSLLKPLPTRARALLRDHLFQGGHVEDVDSKSRRRKALEWVEGVRTAGQAESGWDAKPPILADAHWADLLAGAKFFAMRDAAIHVLDGLEQEMAQRVRSGVTAKPQFSLKESVPARLAARIAGLRAAAAAYLDLKHCDKAALAFASEALLPESAAVLSALVKRDERVLRLYDGVVLAGAAYQDSEDSSEETIGDDGGDDADDDDVTIAWPEGISGRIHNLFLLNADLAEDLPRWLGTVPAEEEVVA